MGPSTLSARAMCKTVLWGLERSGGFCRIFRTLQEAGLRAFSCAEIDTIFNRATTPQRRKASILYRCLIEPGGHPPTRIQFRWSCKYTCSPTTFFALSDSFFYAFGFCSSCRIYTQGPASSNVPQVKQRESCGGTDQEFHHR
jgi:hypothetical protein